MMKKKRLLKSFIVLSLVGILISLYLVQNHYAPPSQGSFCDLGETLSCSLVNTSVFSELFHVPVALLGALWFFSLIIFSWKALSDDKFILFNVGGETENYDALAQCMTQKGVLMYGSFRCGICAKTRAMFGDSFQYIKEIECHPQGKNPQTELCLEKKIEGTPTWMLVENGVEKRAVGFLSIDELRTFSGGTD